MPREPALPGLLRTAISFFASLMLVGPLLAAELPVSQTVSQVLALSDPQLKEGRPVRIRGQITEYGVFDFQGTQYPSLFVQDSTGGVFVDVGPRRFPVRAGDLVELTGRTGRNERSVVVRDPELKRLGRTPLPSAHPSSFAELMSGGKFCQWVALYGTVRMVYAENKWATMDVKVDDGVLEVLIIDRSRDATPLRVEGLLGAKVTIQGVLAESLVAGHLRIYVPGSGRGHIVADAASAMMPEYLRLEPIGLLPAEDGRRVRVAGTVTATEGRSFFLEDSSGGICVRTRNEETLSVGRRAEVTGYIAQNGSERELRFATTKSLPGLAPLRPAVVRAAGALTPMMNGRLVDVNALLIHATETDGKLSLLMQDGDVLFGTVVGAPPVNWARIFVPGASYRLVGVAVHEPERFGTAGRTFRLLMRGEKDIQLLRAPSWWTVRESYGSWQSRPLWP